MIDYIFDIVDGVIIYTSDIDPYTEYIGFEKIDGSIIFY